MKSYILKRFFWLFITFNIVMSCIFFLARSTGDPFSEMLMGDPRIPPDAVEKLRKKYGLDKPLFEQYLHFMGSMYQGEFGYSVTFRKPVFEVILERLPYTVGLLSVAILLSTIFSVFLGAYTAWNRGKKLDIVGTNTALFIRSLPSFWFAMMALLVLGYKFKLFPLFGVKTPGKEYANLFEYLKDLLWHLALPLLTLVIRQIGSTTLYMRGETINVLKEDFITTAKAKGITNRKVLFKHAVRTSLMPMVTVTALRFGGMVSGAIMTETIFALPGTGRLIFQALSNGDYFLLQAAFFMTSIIALAANLIADILYVFIDPRVNL